MSKRIQMQKDTCFLCNEKGIVSYQEGYRYKTKKCIHIYGLGDTKYKRELAREKLDIASKEFKLFDEAIKNSTIIKE